MMRVVQYLTLLLLSLCGSVELCAAITYEGQTTNQGNNSNGSLTVPGVAVVNDVLLVQVNIRNRNGSDAVTAPPGWTEIGTQVRDGDVFQSLYYRVASIGEAGASYNWNFAGNGSRRFIMGMTVFRGVDVASPIAANRSATGMFGTLVFTGSVTTVRPNSMLAAFFTLEAGGQSFRPQIGMTEVYDVSENNTNNGLTSMASYQIQAGVGASGVKIGQATRANDDAIGGLVALNPASLVVIPPDPVAEWRLDETLWTGAGDEVVDESANNLDGRAVNVNGLPGTDIITPAKSGDPGTCRYGVFAGPNSGYVRIDDPGTGSVIDLSTALTVTAWVYPRNYPGDGLSTIVSKDENFEFHITTTGFVNWWWGGGSNEMNSNSALPPNEWSHVAIVYADGAQQIYINGNLDATHNDTGTLTTQNDPVLIGTDLGFDSRTFDGYLDEVRIYDTALTSGQIGTVYTDTHPCSTGPDHYAIIVFSPTVTCEPASVTIAPHDAADTAVAADGTTITLTTSVANDGWTLINGNGALSGNEYTFAGGETSVVLGLLKVTPATVNIDVTDGAASEIEDPDLEFVDTAFKFYGDGVVDSIGTQIAAKSSSVAPGNQTLTIRAIRTDPATGRCEALLDGGSMDIGLAYECNNPTACVLDNDLTLSGTLLQGADSGAPLIYEPVSLIFDATGTAPFVMSYADAGLITLHASAELSVDSALVTVEGSSNAFVVRPAGFCVVSGDANADCASGDSSCSVFRRAGELFDLTVSARAWGGAGEVDSQFCDNAVTPNFKLNSLNLGHTLIAPSSGSLGALGAGSVDIVSGGTATLAQSVSEVGVFTFSAGAVDNYLTAADADIALSNSANIGRFVPAQFSVLNPLLNEANATFTYLHQPFNVTYEIQAEGLAGNNTDNYTAGFANVIAADISYDAVVGLLPAVFDEARIDIQLTTLSWSNGLAEVSVDLAIDRDSVLEAPLDNFQLGVLVEDTEGPYDISTVNVDLDTTLNTIDDHVLLGLSSQRFGRLYIADVWGPESAGLSVPLQVEYWDGGVWRLSDGDETQIARVDIVFTDSGGSAAAIISDPITAPVGTSPNVLFTYDPTGNPVLDFGDGIGGGNGDAGMFVGAPGSPGFFTVDIDLTNFPWLQYDWNQDGDFNDPGEFAIPTATVTFSTYRGHDRIIYWREVLQ